MKKLKQLPKLLKLWGAVTVKCVAGRWYISNAANLLPATESVSGIDLEHVVNTAVRLHLSKVGVRGMAAVRSIISA